MHVLLVEDEEAIRSALARGMTRWGHAVSAAGSLAEARELIACCPPEILVSDLKLPDGHGLELATALGVPFILMSGFAAFEDAVGALRAGCVDFFTKPVAMASLRDALASAASRRRTAEAGMIAVQVDGRLDLVRPSADGFAHETVWTQALVWTSRQEAEDRFRAAVAAGLAPETEERLLLAELLQAAETGRILVNRAQAWWRAWLQAAVAWDDAALQDRRTLLQDVATRCWFRPDGCLVEVAHDR